jgi:predicted patatin/cPLA2 family phospholipase
MTHNLKRALIIEGGAMRGIFAAGVLDSFLDNEFNPFSECYGVSAGSTNLAAYLTRQRGRSYKIITDYSCRPSFFNIRNFISGRHYIDLDWLWRITHKECRLDSFVFEHQTTPFWVVTTNVLTGEAEYHQPNANNLEHVLLASCAVPLAYRDFPLVNTMPQTDGGVADSIPVIEAYKRGARHLTVILSQPHGYRKHPSKLAPLMRLMLKDYPKLATAMTKRHIAYNEAIDFIDNPPSNCTIDVIAPNEHFKVGRTTKDLDTLNHGYQMGILAGQQFVSEQQALDTNAIINASHTSVMTNCNDLQKRPQSTHPL